MITPTTPLFIWGPIDGKPFFTDIWWRGIHRFHEEYVSWPDIIEVVYQKKLYFFCELKELQQQGQQDFINFVLDDNKRIQAWQRWEVIVKQIIMFFKELDAKKLPDCTDQELAKIYEQFIRLKSEFWTIGLLPEVANLGSDVYLQEKLHKIYTESDTLTIIESICKSEKITFYQQAELELLQLKSLQVNKSQMNIFEKQLDQHLQKYHWLLNSYHGCKELSIDYFKEELKNISLEEAEKKIQQITNYLEIVESEQQNIIQKYKLPDEIISIGSVIGFCAWWHYERKKYILQGIYYFTLFLREIEKRKNINFDDLCYFTIEEIKNVLENKNQNKEKNIPDKKEITERKHCFFLYYHANENKKELFTGDKALRMFKPFLKDTINKKSNECKGIVASKGNIKNKIMRGNVRVIHSAQEIKTMKKGEILVSPMTSPDFIIAMKKAKAIITDCGSLTSHAAVVSRELGIPCVVNTRIATRILKTGDDVQIDVEKGLIRKIK